MTDKQIIIDGVDVSGCKHFENADQEMCCELTCCGGCRGINCYYKQLKRKEQECEELKHDNGYEFGALERTIDNLKAEVKSKTEYIQEQRDIINQYSKEIEMYKKCQGKRASKREEELKAENDNIKETFDGLFKVQYKLADNNKKLRQCLTEIKELLKDICIEECCFDWNKTNKKHCGDCDCRFMQLLEKISECEE